MKYSLSVSVRVIGQFWTANWKRNSNQIKSLNIKNTPIESQVLLGINHQSYWMGLNCHSQILPLSSLLKCWFEPWQSRSSPFISPDMRAELKRNPNISILPSTSHLKSKSSLLNHWESAIFQSCQSVSFSLLLSNLSIFSLIWLSVLEWFSSSVNTELLIRPRINYSSVFCNSWVYFLIGEFMLLLICTVPTQSRPFNNQQSTNIWITVCPWFPSRFKWMTSWWNENRTRSSLRVTVADTKEYLQKLFSKSPNAAQSKQSDGDGAIVLAFQSSLSFEDTFRRIIMRSTSSQDNDPRLVHHSKNSKYWRVNLLLTVHMHHLPLLLLFLFQFHPNNNTNNELVNEERN